MTSLEALPVEVLSLIVSRLDLNEYNQFRKASIEFMNVPRLHCKNEDMQVMTTHERRAHLCAEVRTITYLCTSTGSLIMMKGKNGRDPVFVYSYLERWLPSNWCEDMTKITHRCLMSDVMAWVYAWSTDDDESRIVAFRLRDNECMRTFKFNASGVCMRRADMDLHVWDQWWEDGDLGLHDWII